MNQAGIEAIFGYRRRTGVPDVHISLGNKFTVTPQIKGAIKAISGVVDVQDF